MATAKRIYHTEDKHGARKLISARVATQEDLVAPTKAGVEVEDAGATPTTEGGAA